MMEKQLVFASFLLFLGKHHSVNAVVETTVTEVQAGHLAELPCLSNDDHHRFMFWQLKDDGDIFGPSNPLNSERYNYEVLSGKLLIRRVSTNEAGLYKCVAKDIDNHSAFKVHTVELVVKKGWEAMPLESTFETNLLKGMAGLMVFVVGIAVVLLVLLILQRKRSQQFIDLEESRENSPARYRENQNTPQVATPQIDSAGIDNVGLDVDFPKVFTQMQKEQALP